MDVEMLMATERSVTCTRERSAEKKENTKRRATHRRVELACFIVALAAVDQKVDIMGVCSDGVREVRLG